MLNLKTTNATVEIYHKRLAWVLICFFCLTATCSAQSVEPKPEPTTTFSEQITQSIKSTVRLIQKLTTFDDTEKEDREIRDLAAQENMAIWAKEMTRATYVSVGVSIIGLFLVIGTIWYSRSSILISRAQTRAYLTIENVELLPVLDTDSVVRAKTTFKNNGTTPAFDVEANVLITFALSPDGRPFNLATGGEMELKPPLPYGSKIVLGPGSSVDNVVVCDCDSVEQLKAAWTRMLEGQAGIYVYGKIEYLDLFQDAHFTRCQYLCSKITIEAKGPKLIATTQGNYHG